MSSWLVGAIVISIYVAVVVYVVWGFSTLLDAYIDKILRQRFRKDLCGAIKNSQPPWEQLVSIAQSRNLDQKNTYIVVRNLLRDVLTGEETELAVYRDLLEEYVANYKIAEPFEGLPSETRVHLERLREALGTNTVLLDPLTSQIKELVTVYEKDKSRQRLYTVWGFVFGAIGLLFAAYAYFFPYASTVNSSINASPIIDPSSSVRQENK